MFDAVRAAQPETLLVVADGPRASVATDAARVQQTRAVVEQVDWPCRVLRNYAETNMGCKARLASGLNWVFEQCEDAIILEDDCLPHPSFFPFCQAMLQHYRHDARVMMVQGSNFLPGLSPPGSYFFSRYFAVWGWATWRRAWQGYDPAIRDWPARRDAFLAATDRYYTRRATRHLASLFEKAYTGRIDTWDYQWTYHCLFSSGLSIVPRVNLISNIGDEGLHFSTARGGANPFLHRQTAALDCLNLQHPQVVLPHVAYDLRLLAQVCPSRLTRLRQRLARLLRLNG